MNFLIPKFIARRKSQSRKIKDIINNIPFIKAKRNLYFVYYFLKLFCAIIVALFAVFLLVALIYSSQIKNIYDNAVAGKKNIDQAVFFVQEKQFAHAAEYAKSAEENFSFSAKGLESLQNNFLINKIGFLSEQIDDAAHLVFTAEMVSRAAVSGSEIGAKMEGALQLKDKGYNELTVEEKRNILATLHDSGPELNSIKEDMDLAAENIEKVSSRGLLFPIKSKVEELKQYVYKARDFLSKAIPLCQLSSPLFGYPDKSSFLVILQNSDELRPTGGFIGTYGILETFNGDTVRFETHDVYHLDMPVKDVFSVAPPAPLEKYLGIKKWYMRDANWSPDWPESAQKIEWFYHGEDDLLPEKNKINNFSDQFDGVIAITPQLVTELLAYIGPITIDGQVYDKDNFVDLLQYKVERGYVQLGVSSWQRKEVVGEIVNELKVKILNRKVEDFFEIFDIIDSNLARKNILIYFHDPEYQKLAEEKGFAGEIKETDGDYLMVVDANMAALKTDAVIKRSIDYKVRQGASGLFADLSVNYAHFGKFDWKTTRYRTYTRVYVPLGSKLISAGGMSDDEVEQYDENGKTVFAVFLSIEPGKIGNLHFLYQLPANVENNAKQGNYNLFVQKQPGNDIGSLNVDLKLINNVESYQPTGFYAEKIGSKRVVWSTNLKADAEFELKAGK
ncbi:MAG: DUF4012 domain-containing protein [bacterium]